MKKLFAAICIVMLALTACSTSSMNTKADKSKAKGGGGADAAKVGQPVSIKGNDKGSKLQVVAQKVVVTKPTDQFSSVDKGKKLIAVQFTLTNTGSAPYADAPSNGAVVVDKKGQQYESDIFFDSIAAGQMLPSQVKLAPGNKALGFLTFQVPVKAKIAQVQFSMDSGFGDTAQWNVA